MRIAFRSHVLILMLGLCFLQSWYFKWKIYSASKSGHFGWSFHSRITAAGYYYYFPLSFAKTSDPKLIANWSPWLGDFFFVKLVCLKREKLLCSRHFCNSLLVPCNYEEDWPKGYYDFCPAKISINYAKQKYFLWSQFAEDLLFAFKVHTLLNQTINSIVLCSSTYI